MPARILLVDDSLHFIESAERFLSEELGVNVVGSALSGIEAIDQVMRLRPDLVLMDVAMPGMDGLEATHKIKAMPNAPPGHHPDVVRHPQISRSCPPGRGRWIHPQS